MKTTEIKGCGLIGLKVNFNLMDCYEASHLLSRINAILSCRSFLEQDSPNLTPEGMGELLTALDMMKAFLEKIAIEPEQMPSIFTPKEDEPKESEC